MKEELVSFETAKLAKEKGFDIETIFYRKINGNIGSCYHWDEPGDIDAKNWNLYFKDKFAAPSQSLLQKWLREEHKIYVESSFDFRVSIFHYWTVFDEKSMNEENNFYYKRSNEHDISMVTYEEALEIGLQEGLKLIKTAEDEQRN